MYIVDYNNRIINVPLYEWACSCNSTLDTSMNTILWSKLPFYSNIVGDLIYREESFLWQTLFLKKASDFLKPVNYFNNIQQKRQTSSFVRESSNAHSVKETILTILQHKPNYLDFIHVYHRIAKEDNIYYEMFQKSFFYEMFFHLLKKEPIISNAVMLAVCEKYMGLDVNESFLEDVKEFYSHKYAYQIIPRRHGKTFMTGSAFVALLFTFLTCGMRLGYYSHTKDLAQTVKNYVITKCKEWSEKLTHSRYNIMTPTDSVIVKIISDQHGTFFTNAKQDDDFNCLAKFKSARNDNALRGDDLNILIVDEAFSINKCRFGTILAHGQKADNKIIFLTSPVNHKVDEMCEITSNLKSRKDINLYHVYYFCNNEEHLKYASKYPACPNLIFYKPDHIHINETNRFLSNLLSHSTSSFEDELGIVPASYTNIQKGGGKLCPFSDRLLSYMKYNVNIIDDSTCVNNVFIYMDPNYCDSLSSGIGIVATGLTQDQTLCVLYLDHKFIESEELGKANEIMVKMILHCVHHLEKVSMSSSKKRYITGEQKPSKRKFFIAVENNAQRNNCVNIYEKVKECLKRTEIEAYLYYSAVENRITKDLHKQAGYSLLNKLSIFTQTIDYMNENLIWFSSLLTSYYLNKQGKNEIEYLYQNMMFKFSPVERKFSGKGTHSTDDVPDSLIGSGYFSLSHNWAVMKQNWIALACWIEIK